MAESPTTPLSDSAFNDWVDRTLIAIEDMVEELDDGPDFDGNGEILTLEFNDGSKIIINRQSATKQLWVAAKSGGYHLDYDSKVTWKTDTDGESLDQLLSRLFTEQSGQSMQVEVAL